MKNISIIYNPFLLSTKFTIDGKKPRNNSSLDFPKQRLQEWAEKLPEILDKEYGDKNFSVEFTGTLDDFSDLKEILLASDIIDVRSFKHNRTPDVEEVEKAVVSIFDEITNGPVEALKDSKIRMNFEEAIRSEFTINVVATMSSGKSTLINSILGTRLLPMGQMATTATIVRIIASNQKTYSGIAYDRNEEELFREKELTDEIMKEWNQNEDISTIDIYGPIPCVDSVGMRLILMDTPGPNNSRDENHKEKTYGMLKSSEKSLVLFVLNATQLNINDEKYFLDFVYDCMKKGGKQSRDRFIFAVNKINRFDPENGDSVEKALLSVKEGLDQKDIREPNIFPVNALTALELRAPNMRRRTVAEFKELCDYYSTEFHLEDYYHFSHLSLNSRSKLQKLEDCDDEEIPLLIHTGVPSIEEAIRMYVNKYARTMKVKDLVDSFNKRLKELKAVADIEKRLNQNRAERKRLIEEISKIEKDVNDGKTAKEYADRINTIDVSEKVQEELDEKVGGLQHRIDNIILRYNNKTKTPKSEAVKVVAELRSERIDMQSQLEVQIDQLFENSVRQTFEDILSLYQERLSKLGFKTDDDGFVFNPIDFIGQDLADLNDLIAKSTNKVDEGKFETKNVTKTRVVKRSIFNPIRWFGGKYKTETYTTQEKEWVSDFKEYVNMSKVVDSYFVPLQLNLQDVESSVPKHIESEIQRLKEKMKEQMSKLDNILVEKLNVLKEKTESSEKTESEIRKQESDLNWMNGIVEKVNKLINY